MKKFLLVALLIAVSAGTVLAQATLTTIYDIRTGMVPVGEIVQLEGENIVTAVRYNGFALAQRPYTGYGAIWVYTDDDPGVAPGDMVEVLNAEYKEYYDLSELDMTTAGGTVTVLDSGRPIPGVTAYHATILADPEAYESHLVEFLDDFMVSELLSYGQWTATSYDDGSIMMNDDYFFDSSVLEVGSCYQGATGMWTFSYGEYKLHPLSDGLTVVDCTVGNTNSSFGAVKALYR